MSNLLHVTRQKMASNDNRTLLFLVFSFLSLLQINSCIAQNVKGGYWFLGSGITASDIDSTLFTHLFCAFADLDASTNQVVISSSNAQSFATFTSDVQQKNPSVLTLLSIGGGGGGSIADNFASMASQSSSRKTFIDSSIALARSNGFHGLDLDWEYPDTDAKMANLALLLQEWRAAVAAEAASSGKDALLLSAAVYYRPHYWSPTDYPAAVMAANLDWINAMAYDFFGSWSSTTGPLAALYNPGNGLSGDDGVSAWIQAGMPAGQIVLGFPFYGRAFTLADANNHGYFAPITGTAISPDGSIVYNQITKYISQHSATTVYNSTVVSAYCYSGTTWITYDDTQTISTKVGYAKGRGLKGYFAWHVGGDDNWVLSQTAQEAIEDQQHRRWFWLVMLISIAIVVFFIFGLICYLQRRTLKSEGILGVIKGFSSRFKTMAHKVESPESGAPNLQAFHYATLRAATDNFSSENKLGEGGFGPVYKGKLPKGQDIAVKRLSKTSDQGLEEFKNEVVLTASLQHVNLVHLLGFCTDMEEKMLIYEYMPHRSLDFYLFDPTRKYLLDWEKRVHIIEGITQGLLYLQEYSNFTIIHRDLKASNVLLDKEMNPKISDFGMARIFRKGDLEANTGRIVGTYGYVPPEYVRKGIYSMKYDVYSFGVLLLQIISGKRTRCYYGPNENLNLLEFAYELWKEDKCMEFIDPSLDDSSSSCKLARCMQVALLCVQEEAGDRPSMLDVSSMLKNEASAVNSPKKPAFSIKKEEDEDDKCFPKEAIHSANGVSISELCPR
ncbi:G-type lectin S-receptor-like serine/threonine-protein kinase At1g67520 isoform X2 [Rhodamnia argentea]|uniref:G-type lectin S-receptor-like serine/threonine-protein kinase At1g67520 isoform X2 n=1 Tax=Rhodamnia argentea TaxID=178133 RepID=A0A8B8QHV7_9MYRT|nr:G-type lectin S-receptor-like serine/threonine-protein kinase At1g67520 isoform X2 [Rhodamnia argentea]